MRTRKSWLTLIILILALAAAWADGKQPHSDGGTPVRRTTDRPSQTATAAPAPASAPASATAPGLPAEGLVTATITRVTDGDTVRARLQDGTEEKIRLIGVNTPEVFGLAQPYGAEASAYTKANLPAGTGVWLEFDAERRDRYGRLLAYVWTEVPNGRDDSEIRGKMFNARLALEGIAQQMTIPPNVRYAEYFREYVAEARNADKGLWAQPR